MATLAVLWLAVNLSVSGINGGILFLAATSALSKPSTIGWKGGLLRFLKRQNLSRCRSSRRINRNSRYELWIADRKLLHQFERFLNVAVEGDFLRDSFAARAHHHVPVA
jgi:hypothetical protein